MILAIGCSEATLYDENRTYVKHYKHMGDTLTHVQVRKLGFVGGATILTRDGTEICSVSGSDEYGFEIKGVVEVYVKRKTRYTLRKVIAIVGWSLT